MRRQRHLKQAASRFLRQSLVNHQSRELPCRQMIDRVFPSCPSSWLRCNLTSWIILSGMGFRLSDRVCEHHTQANSCMSLEMALLVDVSRLPKSVVLTIEAGQLPTPGDPVASLTSEKPPC